MKKYKNGFCRKAKAVGCCPAGFSARRALCIWPQRDFFGVMILIWIFNFALFSFVFQLLVSAADVHKITSNDTCGTEMKRSVCMGAS